VPTMSVEMEQVLNLWKIEESESEFSLYDFDQIADATNNFSDESKLGQGGFGPVYKVQYYYYSSSNFVHPYLLQKLIKICLHGFRPVYNSRGRLFQGELPDGTEIAIKRLSSALCKG
jgi:hypothetical protein